MLNAYNIEFDETLPGPPHLISKPGQARLHLLAATGGINELREYLKSYDGPIDLTVPPTLSCSFEVATPLLVACRAGNFDAVKLLINRGADVNKRCEGVNSRGLRYSTTPLYISAIHGYLKIVKYLGEHGADVNARTSPFGYTALHGAVYYGCIQTAGILLYSFNADPDIPSNEDFCNYPLLKAAAAVDIDMMKMILSSRSEGVKSNPNVKDSDEGLTALHLAVIAQDFDAVELLVYIGCDINAQLRTGHTPLDLAYNAEGKISNFLKSQGAKRNVDEDWIPFIFTFKKATLYLLEKTVKMGSNVNVRLFLGRRPLHYAVMSKEIEVINLLIKEGADINALDFNWETPLSIAVLKNDTELVQLLIDKGADLNVKDGWGATALHHAALSSCNATLKLLIANGASVSDLADNLGTPLFLASLGDNNEGAEMLLAAGADVNAKCVAMCSKGLTPLHAACSSNCPPIIKTLIRNGANVNALGDSSAGKLSPLHFLIANGGGKDILDAFITMVEAGAFFDSEEKVVIDSEPKTFTELMKSQAIPEVYKIYDNTRCLFQAVKMNCLHSVRECASQGGLVNCCSASRETPLMHSVEQDNKTMFKILLELGAIPHLVGVTWDSPLHIAAKYDRRDMAFTLMRSGARLSFLCNGITALEVAIKHGHHHLVSNLVFIGKYLLETGQTKLSPLPNFKKDKTVQKVIRQCGDRAPPTKALKAIFSAE